MEGKRKLEFDLIEKAVKIWPVNYNEFFSVEDDTKHGFKIFKSKASNSTERKMYRGGEAYYLYKDTVMSKVSTFRPEWIQQLKVVDNSNPNNNGVKFNNGHFLHQFTYFKNLLGNILALTYADKLNTESLNEFSAIGYELTKKFNLNLKNKIYSFKSSLLYHLKNSSISDHNFKELTGLNLNRLLKNKKLPNKKVIDKIATFLKINSRDLLPPIQNYYVKIQKY
mgnify:CR=1 FL=1